HDGRDWRVYTLVQGSHALQVAQAQDERAAIARQTALRTLLPFVALIPFFGVLIWVGVGRGLQPLAASLNGLLERLSDAIAAQRRFTADAAHELRTPLAALKLQLDLARRATDPQARAGALDDLEAGVARASHVVEQLMTLARVEPEAMAQMRTQCDLVALAKEAIVSRATLAADKGIDLGLARESAAIVDGDPASLGILLSNLIDNALRHTPRGGRIDVSVERAADAAALVVAD